MAAEQLPAAYASPLQKMQRPPSAPVLPKSPAERISASIEHRRRAAEASGACAEQLRGVVDHRGLWAAVEDASLVFTAAAAQRSVE